MAIFLSKYAIAKVFYGPIKKNITKNVLNFFKYGKVSNNNESSRMINNINEILSQQSTIITEQCDSMDADLLGFHEEDLAILSTDLIELLNLNSHEAISKLTYAIMVSNKTYKKLLLTIRKKNLENIGNVRKSYLKVLNSIEEAIECCESIRSELTNELPLTEYKLSTIKFLYSKKLIALDAKLSQSNLDQDIVEILLTELKVLTKEKIIYRGAMTYAIDLASHILMSENLSKEKLEQILIEYNFNSRAFCQYCLNNTDSLILEVSSLHQQLDMLISLEEKLNSLIQYQKGNGLFNNRISIAERLKKYYMRKKDLIIQRIDARRTEMLDSKLCDDNEKIAINLSVAKFGFLIRLFIEKGYLPHDNIGKTFSFFAKHFKTPNTTFISAESLQKKSSTVEFQTAIKTKGMLLEMVNYVNKDHNASHYTEK